ncbi:MAG: response regulator transcription factor [Solirubrobacterales bacterium]
MQSGRPYSLAAAASDFPAPLSSTERTITIAGLEIRPDSREVLSATGRVQLTGRELDVLTVLVEHPDRVVTRDTIYAEVWGGHMPYRDRAADVYVRRVREKLRALAPNLTYIHTHFGIGYRFWPEPGTDAQ